MIPGRALSLFLRDPQVVFTILDPWHCAPQVSMKAFDRMKTRDMAPGVWDDNAYKGHILYSPLAESFLGVIRIVPNPVILERGVISGELDHPVFSLVCSPSTGISNWSDTIWDYVSPWGRFLTARRTSWTLDNTYHSPQVLIYPRSSMNWMENHSLDVDRGVPLIEELLLGWETSILRLYFEWKVSNLRWECCEFLRKLIKANTHLRAPVYVYRSNAPAHRNLVQNKTAAYEFFGY
jgi:hypothetical protein